MDSFLSISQNKILKYFLFSEITLLFIAIHFFICFSLFFFHFPSIFSLFFSPSLFSRFFSFFHHFLWFLLFSLFFPLCCFLIHFRKHLLSHIALFQKIWSDLLLVVFSLFFPLAVFSNSFHLESTFSATSHHFRNLV